ncbi:AcrR family transcriptional regulator [Actinoplanes tereljensis]|uniref:TetR family transcriptional regulator n=1 Tax=Paractinoplanes tereljensis TaxID=571912 RepID=A0A919TW70_9ACTN|nr:TetR/AcrR family transcriptional regulator C-terminal domain-containing protein [Actinoplanes tereljensis]GIF25638.1 TetR family transcriptional regulator [Actinoplanes tereljensis]
MPRRSDERSAVRPNSRLSREGIVAAAIDLADRDGLAGFSMRRLAQHLGVDAMSIYYHVRDKDTLLAAMTDAVATEIAAGDQPAAAGPWTEQLRALIMRARGTMLRHPWAARVIEERDNPTPAVLLHIERVLAIMRGGGCSVDLGHHAIHLLGSRILGFSQDLFDDNGDGAPVPDEWAKAMPHVAELAAAASHTGALGPCDDDAEFAFALDLLLDGLERRRIGAVA